MGKTLGILSVTGTVDDYGNLGGTTPEETSRLAHAYDAHNPKKVSPPGSQAPHSFVPRATRADQLKESQQRRSIIEPMSHDAPIHAGLAKDLKTHAEKQSKHLETIAGAIQSGAMKISVGDD